MPKLNHQTTALGCDDKVQWAAKVTEPASSSSDKTTTTTAVNIRTELQRPQSNPKELREFCDLLRDRYDGKRSLRAAFLNWDRDKDGRLSGKEVREMINTLGFATRLGPEKVEVVIQHIGTLPSSYAISSSPQSGSAGNQMSLKPCFAYMDAALKQESSIR